MALALLMRLFISFVIGLLRNPFSYLNVNTNEGNFSKVDLRHVKPFSVFL